MGAGWRSVRSVIVALGASGAGLVAVAARAEPAPVPRVTYTAPATCPSQAVFERELLTQLDVAAVPLPGDLAFGIAITGDDGGSYAGTVRVLGPQALVTERRVSDADCREVVRAAAFIAALLSVEVRKADAVPASPAAASGETPAPPTPPPEAPDTPDAPDAPEAPDAPNAPVAPPPADAPRFPLGVAAWMGLGLESAMAPQWSPGPRLGVGVRGRAAVAPAARLSVARYASPTLHATAGDAELVLVTVRADACLALDPRRRLELVGCAVGAVGTLRGSGSSPVGPRSRASLWLAPGGSLRVAPRLVGPLAAFAEAGLSVPIARPSFVFETAGGGETVHRVPALGFSAELGLSLHFP